MGDRFPLQKDCDPAKPEEHFLWALTQIPYSDRVTQPIQPKIAKVMSAHLHNLGFRHHPNLQKSKMQMPHRGQQHTLNGMAMWVPMDSEEPDPIMLPDVRQMTRAEQELLKQELEDIGIIKDPPKDIGPLAEITSWRDLQSTNVVRAQDVIPKEASG